MKNMKNTGLDKVIKAAAKEGKPILGICLGMQLLFEESEEVEKCRTWVIKRKHKKIRRFYKNSTYGME